MRASLKRRHPAAYALTLVMVLGLTVGALAQSPKRALFFMHGDADLMSLLRAQLADWDVREGTGSTPGSARDAAAVSVDGSGEGLRAIVEYAGQLRMSPLPPRSEPGWERVFVLVVEGLLIECERAASTPIYAQPALAGAERLPAPPNSIIEVAPPFPDVVVVPVETAPAAPLDTEDDAPPPPTATHRFPRKGWVIRVGGAHGRTPIVGATPDNRDFLSSTLWGVRASVGRWVLPYLRLDLTGHWAIDEFGPGSEGAVGMQAMVLSRSFFRVGIGLETSAVFALDAFGASVIRPQVGMPIELGFDFGRVGGLYGHFTPSYTHSTYAIENIGFLVSAEWEVPLGH